MIAGAVVVAVVAVLAHWLRKPRPTWGHALQDVHPNTLGEIVDRGREQSDPLVTPPITTTEEDGT